MYCHNCGAAVTGKMKFCVRCGFSLPPVSPAPQKPMKSPKKKKLALWISLSAVFVIIVIAVSLLGSIFLFKPRNLNVTYTLADYDNALNKLGIETVIDGKSGDALNEYLEVSGKLSVKNYNWEYLEPKKKNITLSPAELTAFLNKYIPNFWCYDDIQINIQNDGSVELSGKIDVNKLSEDLNIDISNQLSISIPGDVNIYIKGKFSITNNKLTLEPEEFDLGTISLSKSYMTEQYINNLTSYFDLIFTSMPGLKIDSLKADENGSFVFKGTIPQRITAKRIQKAY